MDLLLLLMVHRDAVRSGGPVCNLPLPGTGPVDLLYAAPRHYSTAGPAQKRTGSAGNPFRETLFGWMADGGGRSGGALPVDLVEEG